MKLSHLRFLVAVGSCMLLQTAPLQAAVEFTSFDPGDAFVPEESDAVTGPSSPSGLVFSFADEFTAAFTGKITSVDVAVSYFEAGTASIDLELYQNNPATNLPLLASGISLGELTATAFDGSVQTLTLGSAGVSLSAGGSYWLALMPASATTYTGWNFADNASAANVAYSTDGGATYRPSSNSASAFDINAVPEPSTWAAMLGGVGVLSLLRRKRIG